MQKVHQQKHGWSYKNNKWKKNNKELKLNLVVNAENEKRTEVAQNIKTQLEEIGIGINIIKVNNYIYKEYLKNKQYDMILTGKIVSNSINLESYFGEDNLSNYKNENTNQILKDLKNIENEEQLKSKYKELLDIYNTDIPFIPLYTNSLFILTNKKLKGDISCNWYNLFYNINDWYKEK